jgi:hypothetical protein
VSYRRAKFRLSKPKRHPAQRASPTALHDQLGRVARKSQAPPRRLRQSRSSLAGPLGRRSGSARGRSWLLEHVAPADHQKVAAICEAYPLEIPPRVSVCALTARRPTTLWAARRRQPNRSQCGCTGKRFDLANRRPELPGTLAHGVGVTLRQGDPGAGGDQVVAEGADRSGAGFGEARQRSESEEWGSS